MPTFENARKLLVALRERLDGWVYEARGEAYDERFTGPDALLTADELVTVDRIDSRLSREGEPGVWGADEYRIVPAGAIEEESAPRVVPTYYPQIPANVPAGAPLAGGETRERFNDALWTYAERVVELAQAKLESFVWSSEVETWAE